jgi:shikimate kinase
MNQAVCLIGMRGTGKTTLGKSVADKLGIPFYDLDHQIEMHLGESIRSFFEREGEAAFRALEHHQLMTFLPLSSMHIISVGGGIIETPVCRDLLRQHWYCIHLTCDETVLFTRLNTSTRPRLTSQSLRDEIHTILKRRTPKYQTLANWTLNTSYESIADLTDRVVSHLYQINIVSI